MTPTSKSLEAMYIMLCQLKPVNRWNLPNTAEIKFVVTKDEDCYGSYVYDDDLHVITISSAKCGHFETILKTLAHECCHMKIAGPTGDGEGWDKHHYRFKQLSKSIADEFGYDPLEL
jgi:hypothetical protein